MKERTRKIFIMIVMAALIVSLMAASFAALTYGRYSGGRRDENSAYVDDILDLVGETAFEVSTADELVNAINNGYSYIKIADDAEEPFVINNNVADVYTNLVLDVNGHVVVRNSRNPLLDVRRSISVVLVYDSSTDADGGFYNPVGSSLQTSGGTLTVGEGVYESGPKIESVPHVTTAEISDVFVRNGERAKATSYERASSAAHLPKLTKDVYLENNVTEGYLRKDTYLLYTVEKNGYVDGGQLYVNAKKDVNGTVTSAEEFSPICNVASCDFYYYYPVDADGSPIDTEGTQDTPQTYAVIYGYNDVKALARDEKKTDENGIEYGMASALTGSGLVWPYAAIRSVEDEDTQEGGVTHARGGVFKTHFGEENTYCIYSAGGTMTVGTSGSAGGPAFEAVGSGVCIAMTGASDNVSEGGSLTISGGTFSSRLGNTIEMEGGKMTVTAGKFTKSGGKGIGSGSGEDQAKQQVANQTAMIDMQGGKLNVSGTKTGDTYSVTMTAGGTDDNGNTLTLENVFGILAHGGGEVSVGGCTFNIYGDYSAGVLSYDGTINLKDNTFINVTQSDAYKRDGKTLLTSSAVSSEASAGDHPINMSGNVQITSNGLGITARGNINIKEADDDQSATQVQVETTRATGIYVNGGTFKVERRAQISVKSTVSADYAWGLPPEGIGTSPNIYNGIYVENGSIDASAGTLNVTHTGVAGDTPADSTTDAATKSYAVFVKGDAEGGSQNTTVRIGKGSIAGKSAGGIYVSGGELTAGAVTVSAGGTALNDNFTANASTYAAGVLVETGTVTLSGAKIYSTALGVAVLGGNFKTEGTSSVTATRATGIYVQGGTVTNSGTLEVTSDLFDDSGNLYESAGADFGGSSTAGGNIYNGIFVNGGSLVSEGVSSILNVTFRGAAGDEPSSASGATKSYAVYVTNSSDDGATETTNTYASIREGALNAVQAGGVYLRGGDVVLGAQYNENDEVVGHGTVAIKTGSLNGNAIDSSAGTYGAGVFADNGKAVLYGTVNVDCAALGIVAVGSGGKEDTVSIAEDAAVTVNASRATGVYVQGGTVTNSGELDVTSTISSSWENEGADFENASFKTSRFNGIFVNGGSLESTGTLNVTHTGVENDVTGIYENSGYTQTAQTDAAKLYRTFNITSYAIRVEAAEDVASNVTIVEGEITNQVGGGILVNNTVSGSVKLGRYAPDAASNNLHVLANGTEVYGGKGVNGPKLTFIENSNWPYRLPKTGGPALKMSGGTLEVYGGTYQTNQGDGIVTVGGTSIIYDGKFIGADTYRVDENSPQAGPGASYAFKVYGGEANVYGGTFGDPKSTSGASGAFVMGTGNSETEQGTANIYGGTFEVSSSTNSGGQAAFSIYEFGKLVVTENGGSATVNNTTITGGKVTMTGYAAGLAIEENTDNKSTVVINSGTFSSTSSSGNSDGIWYGSNHADLTITGGTFKGAARSGLWFEYSLSDGKVQLSDGTYDGPNGAINANSPESINTKQIFKTESGGNSWLNDGNNDPIYYKHDWHLISGLNFGYYHDHVGGDQDLSLSSDLDTSSPVRVQALTDYDTIIVTTTQAPSYEE